MRSLRRQPGGMRSQPMAPGRKRGWQVRNRGRNGSARSTVRRGTPDHQVDDGPNLAGEHDHEHPGQLVPALNFESSGTLTTSTSAQIQTMKAASARTTMTTADPSDDTFELLWDASPADTLPADDRATVVSYRAPASSQSVDPRCGLGSVARTFVPRAADELAREEAPNSGGDRTGDA
jgi:hypothetical protein